MTHEVIFEKKVGDQWKPTSFSDLTLGDMARLKCSDGSVLEEGKILAKNDTDPDSHQKFDLGIGG